MRTDREWRERSWRYKPVRENPPPSKGNKKAKLTPDQIKACYILYQQGLTVYEIADKIWEKYGYSSPDTAKSSIYQFFHSYKYKIRTPSEAAVASRNICSKCKALTTEYTPGCSSCMKRHAMRRYRERKKNG